MEGGEPEGRQKVRFPQCRSEGGQKFYRTGKTWLSGEQDNLPWKAKMGRQVLRTDKVWVERNLELCGNQGKIRERGEIG